MNLEIIRHSAEHILSMAVLELYPDTKLVMGPATKDGFYGDFEFSEQVNITPNDLRSLEIKMEEIVNRNLSFERKIVSLEEAKILFKDNPYKLTWLEEIALRGEEVSLYYTGDSFYDLCIGPHLQSTGQLKAFKLLSIAGAYWRGDAKNKMLTRIYGTAFATKQELDNALEVIKEAKKRDHRKIGKEMDWFHFDPQYAPGAVFWHDRGYRVFRKLVDYMRDRQCDNGYIEVSTPTVMDRVLWETSGHWEQYGKHNYSGNTQDGRVFCIKPMNCPGSILIYKQGIKSYRDLPLKMAEFGKVNRYEPSGSLMGLMRVREFTQDDAHIFCTPKQVKQEAIATLRLILDIYRDFGFEQIKIYLSTRPVNRIGSDEIWDLCENALKSALEANNYHFEINEGEGAFYGPKLEFILKDALGREWQCGTVQVDMNLPERFDLNYIGEDGLEHRPVMLHRALFGSIERFLGILIEHYAGKLPLWLMPITAVVATISEGVNQYAMEVYQTLKDAGLSVDIDLSNEKIGYKIRKHTMKRIPYLIILGDKEQSQHLISVRCNNKTDSLTIEDFLAQIQIKMVRQK